MASPDNRSRKPSFRPSIARQSLAARPSIIPPSSISRNIVAPTPLRSARKSVLPMSTSIARSMGNPTSVTNRDPRPLRDKNFQNAMIQKIQEYLVSNNFEIEVKHSLTPKTLRSPTQKDFVIIFQWLYHRLDPAYRFTRSIDNEVYMLLRVMEYPYFDSINKSQLAAVGGQTWPTILGLLSWMVDLNQALEKYDQKLESSEKTDEDVLSDIIERYSTNCYRAYLQNERDFSEYDEETEREIQQFRQSMANSIEEAESENMDVRRRYDRLLKENENMNLLEEKREALESDLVKFKEYVSNLERRKVKWTNALNIIHEEVSTISSQHEELRNEYSELERELTGRNISPEQIDKIWSEREQLSKNLDIYVNRQEALYTALNDKFDRAGRIAREIESAVEQYNSRLYAVGINDESIHINLKAPLHEDNLGMSASQLLHGKDIQTGIRQNLISARSEANAQLHELENQCIQAQEVVERVNETLAEKQEAVETLQARLNSDKIAYDELYETMNSNATAANAKIERMEREIHTMQVTVQQGLQQLEKQCDTVDSNYSQLKEAIESSRMEMNDQLTDMINTIVSFKLHVQESLEEHEGFVASLEE